MTTATIEEMRAKCAAGRETKVVDCDGLRVELRPIRAGGLCAFQAPYTTLGKKSSQRDREKAVQLSQLALLRNSVVAPDISGLSDSELLGMPPTLWGEMVNAAMELSGLTDADVEELTKNSEETAGDDSPSV